MRYQVIQGDCLEVLDTLKLKADCIFADPPDNIGLTYKTYHDRRPDYVEWLALCIEQFMEAAPIVWLSFNARWTVKMGTIVDRLLMANSEWQCKPCVQVYTFGQHNKHDLGNNYRPLWRLNRKGARLYPDQIKVPSWRQRHGDRRAAEGGRVPGDVFDMQRPGTTRISDAELADVFARTLSGNVADWPQLRPLLARLSKDASDPKPGDVFDFPRVTGNSKQRCDWHPTQIHEDLVERCIKFCTQEGDTVLDPFGGTGTTLRVCKRINRACTLIELDPSYCQRIASEHRLADAKAA